MKKCDEKPEVHGRGRHTVAVETGGRHAMVKKHSVRGRTRARGRCSLQKGLERGSTGNYMRALECWGQSMHRARGGYHHPSVNFNKCFGHRNNRAKQRAPRLDAAGPQQARDRFILAARLRPVRPHAEITVDVSSTRVAWDSESSPSSQSEPCPRWQPVRETEVFRNDASLV